MVWDEIQRDREVLALHATFEEARDVIEAEKPDPQHVRAVLIDLFDQVGTVGQRLNGDLSWNPWPKRPPT